MLPFRIHRFQARGVHYLLLPKMRRAQMRLISKRLDGAGYTVELSTSLSARSGKRTIHVEPSGVCRSTIDVTDLVVPTVPDILASEKARVPMGELMSMYLTAGRSGKKTEFRFTTRTESWFLWDLMRASGECYLSPDEHAVAAFLFGRAGDACEVLTDFPERGSEVKMLGGRRYFNSRVSPALAAMTLRVAGRKLPRNSYLSRDGVMEFARFDMPPAPSWFNLFDSLGEWCYFAPG